MSNNMNANLIPLQDKINKRVGHVAVSYKGNFLVWGGYMEYAASCYYHATDELFIYETHSELWDRKLLKGDIPPRSSGGCGVILDHTLYIFGGQLEYDGSTNNLYALNLLTMTWTRLKPEGIPPVPCDKLVGWAHNEKLYYFGGFGPIPDRHVFFEFVVDGETGCAWNNQLFAYNSKTNHWEWPYFEGNPPCPRAAHAGDKCGHLMFISGGRLKTARKSDLYVLDMDTMIWSENINENAEVLPLGRSWHSFTFISPHRAVLYGGFSTYNNVLNDCWIVDMSTKEEAAVQAMDRNNTRKWKVRYMLPPHTQRFVLRRFWHRTVYFEKTGDLICLGGFNRLNSPPIILEDDEDQAQDLDLKLDHTDVMLVVHFQPMTLLRLSLNASLKYHKMNQFLWGTLPQTLHATLAKRFCQFFP